MTRNEPKQTATHCATPTRSTPSVGRLVGMPQLRRAPEAGLRQAALCSVREGMAGRGWSSHFRGLFPLPVRDFPGITVESEHSDSGQSLESRHA